MKDENLSFKTNANLKSKRHFLWSRNVAEIRFTSYLWSEGDVWCCERLYKHSQLKIFKSCFSVLSQRDLAARNVLLTHDFKAKIADFGLSDRIYSDLSRQGGNNAQVPYKWSPYETLETCISIKEKSDVWSFGVVLFEIFSFGQVLPYADLYTPEAVLAFLNSGKIKSGVDQSGNAVEGFFTHARSSALLIQNSSSICDLILAVRQDPCVLLSTASPNTTAATDSIKINRPGYNIGMHWTNFRQPTVHV